MDAALADVARVLSRRGAAPAPLIGPVVPCIGSTCEWGRGRPESSATSRTSPTTMDGGRNNQSPRGCREACRLVGSTRASRSPTLSRVPAPCDGRSRPGWSPRPPRAGCDIVDVQGEVRLPSSWVEVACAIAGCAELQTAPGHDVARVSRRSALTREPDFSCGMSTKVVP